jgi:hypothetical protein
MKCFKVTTEGQDKLGLRAVCERYVNEQWYAAHMTDEQAAEALLDQFKRAVAGELELLVVEARCGV